MLDIDKPDIGIKEQKMVLACLKEGTLTQGRYVLKLEKEFAEYFGMDYACAVMNGTVALHLALVALGIKEGDEVLVPSLTFIASISPVTLCRATPVFVDCDPQTWCMDPQDLRKKITRRTKAIIPVHLYGNACDMDKIVSIARRNNLKIIEDCAESHGTLYRKKKMGTFSDISFFSLFKNKHMTTGEGGMCLTNDPCLNARMRMLRSHGKEKAEALSDEDYAQRQFISSELGFNYRMTDLQAAIGLVQLKKIEKAISRRINNAQLYRRMLDGLDIVFPFHDDKIIRHSYWMFPVLLKNPQQKVKVMLGFRDNRIRMRPFFSPCHQQPFYLKYRSCCPVSEDVSQRGIVFPTIHTLKKEQIEVFVKLFRKILQ